MIDRLSHSQLNGWTGCGYRYHLERNLKVPQVPAWNLIGGSAVHETTEARDLARLGQSHFGKSTDFYENFDRLTAEAEDKHDMDRAEFRASGRSSKAYPEKENQTWWLDNGPSMVQRWDVFISQAPWDIWILPDGKPAVEIGFELPVDPDENGEPRASVRGYIDRVVQDRDGNLIVLDIKGLAVDTPIPTPSGWSTMGDLQVGDEVFGPDGKPTTVVVKSEVKHIDTYRVTFDDATSIVCDGEHVWETHAGPKGLDRAVRSVQEIADSLHRVHRIPVSEPVSLPTADLPLHPYVLGVWLGDGKHTSGEFTTAREDTHIPEVLRALGCDVREHPPRKDTVSNYNIAGLIPTLRELGVYRNKHVPAAYLRGSIDQRLALLRGLMDTDGTVNIARGNRVAFAVTDAGLADAVHELASSLGERVKRSTHTGHGFGKDVTVHVAEWRPYRFNPFSMPRKAEEVRLVQDGAKATRRAIMNVERIDSVPTQCIGVDSDSHLYLAGREWIATHNTGASKQYSNRQLGTYRVGLQHALGIDAKVGAFWDARSGGATVAPLNDYTFERIQWHYQKLRMSRELGVYLPNPGPLCGSCSVNASCFEYTPEASASIRPPWLTEEEWGE